MARSSQGDLNPTEPEPIVSDDLGLIAVVWDGQKNRPKPRAGIAGPCVGG